MATVNPVVDWPAPGVMRITWDAIATGDTINWATIPHIWLAQACVHAYADSGGSWGGATVSMQESNADDNDGEVSMVDTLGSAISFTGDGKKEISISSLKIRPAISGGTSDDVNVVVVARGGIVNYG